MGRKSRGKGKLPQEARESSGGAPVDRGTLAQCLNATSQIAAECNSILRDLLRGRSPQHQDLQRLASQVLMGQTMNLQELQKKMESQQATLAELLKVLKPATGGALDCVAGQEGGYQLPEPSVSVIKGWDSFRDSTYVGAVVSAKRRRSKAGNNAHASGSGGARPEGLSKRERYLAVEGYWRSMTPDARRAALTAPVCRVIEVATTEGGAENAREVVDGLRLLKRNASRHACYWRCPCCDLRTADSEAFFKHLAAYHEGVQYSAEDTPMLCSSCGQEIVGAFFHAGEAAAPSATECLRCAWDSGGSALTPPPGWQLHVPQPSALLDRTWSGSVASTEAMTANSGGSPTPSMGSSDEESGGSGGSSSSRRQLALTDGTGAGGSSSDALVPASGGAGALLSSEVSQLEARVRSGADGLLAAIAARIDALARTNRPAFEVALAGVVQRAQRLMHGAPSPAEDALAVGAVARREATERLRGPAAADGDAEDLRLALCLLSPSELQDLLALMARRYSPHPHHHLGRYDGNSDPATYQPTCVALVAVGGEEEDDAERGVVSKNGNGSGSGAGKELALKGDSSGAVAVAAAPAAPGPGATLYDLPEVEDNEAVVAKGWWAEHLAQKSWLDLGTVDDTYLLQWVYGNVAHGATDEFLERQRMSCGAKSADAAVVDACGEVAETWRHLAATMDRKRHVTTLREAVAEDVEAVLSFDATVVAALRAQANEFFAEVAADAALAAAAAGSGPMDAAWSQRALGKLQRFHQLKDEGSIRYAQALIDREIAVLELAEVMDQHECDVAERELQTVEAALGAARQDLLDAEAELTRTQAEGPALHRKRDLLDRVNKEAEHRERVQELQAHIASCNERIASEETYGAGARRRREEAASDLDEGRAELQGYLERRQALDRACHAVLAAQERDKGQELTDAYVDARIKAVWQVVAGVADAILTLHDRYTPGAATKESTRHLRCTSLAKSLMAELDERVRVWCEELDKHRRRVADLACVDAGQAVEASALEAVRQALEERAAAAREAATLDLLRELEAEEEAKKAAESKKAKKKAGKTGKKGGKEEGKAASSGDISGGEGDGEAEGDRAEAAEGDAANPDNDAEYEAALERRRQELERQEADRLRAEADLIRQAQEASLKEAATPAAAAPATATAAVSNGGSQAAKGGKAGKPTVITVPVPIKSARNAGANASSAHGNSSFVKSPEKPPPRVVIVHRTAPGTPSRPKTVEVAKKEPSVPPVVVTVPISSVSGKHAAGASAAPGTAAGTKAGSGEMRIITYYGDWICFCNRTNRLWDTCACGQIPPCRDWVRGRCTYKDRCRFAHPPFELPDSLPRPKSPIAKPGPDAVVYKKARAAAGVATVPKLATATPDAKLAAGAPKTAVPVATVKPAAPPPLKPAPWAGVRPGSATGPSPLVSPAAVAPIAAPAPTPAAAASAAVTPKSALPAVPLPAAPPAQQQQFSPRPPQARPFVVPASFPHGSMGSESAAEDSLPLPQLQSLGMSMSPLGASPRMHESLMQQQQQQQPPAPEFNPFASSLLMQALAPSGHSSGGGGHPHASQLTASFPSLSLGPSLMPNSPPSGSRPPPHTSQLFGPQGAGLPGSFLGGPSPAVGFQPGSGHHSLGYPAHQSMGASPMGMGGLAFSPGGLGGLAPPPGMLGGGGGLGAGGGGPGSGDYDDWGDLQLRLPSDLGEMLGADPLPMAGRHEAAQPQPGGDLFGHQRAAGSGPPPGWSAF